MNANITTVVLGEPSLRVSVTLIQSATLLLEHHGCRRGRPYPKVACTHCNTLIPVAYIKVECGHFNSLSGGGGRWRASPKDECENISTRRKERGRASPKRLNAKASQLTAKRGWLCP